MARAVKKSDRMEALGTLAQRLAHDVNNILSVIDSAAQSALAKGAPQPEMKKIITAAQTGGTLTRQLLAFSGHQVAVPETIELKSAFVALGSVIQPLLGLDIRLSTGIPPRLAVQASQEQLALLALNLALNARDAMPGGGTFKITAAARGKTSILMSFIDSGIGIRESDRKKIFDPFFSTKAQGAGLGLSVVHGIVTQLGGSIKVTSKAGKGARFDIILPRAAPQKVTKNTAPEGLLNVLALALKGGQTKYLEPSNGHYGFLPPKPKPRGSGRLEKTLQRARDRRAERLKRGEDDDENT